MKIGIIAHLKHPIRKPFMGGLEAFTYDITQLLIERGHEVTLFASEMSDPSLNVYPIMSDTDYDRETLSRFRSHEMSEDFISTHHAYLELMQDIDTKEFDIIFNNSLNYVPITMASICSTPMVTVLHTPPIFEMKRATAREKSLGRITYVSVSKPNADAWKPYVHTCEVINNGIDLQQWRFIPSNDKGYVVWFGRIHPDKGPHLAIEAAKLAGKRIKIAGSVADRHYFETFVQPLLDDRAEWVEHCTHEQLNVLIGDAEASIITPCWDEPFGLVVAESLACGTPVAGIARGALPSILNEKTGVLTKSCDPEELAKCIHAAARLKREDCREHAMQHLCRNVMVAQYEHLFSEVVAKRFLRHAI
ncbi:glycosyltransferase family 4 protein [Sphingobacterium paludis]|uniref:Glycosyltransferase involved in cell wall biosynthesis n=1 Tax=Sphingobacterium paludis TaxID=1476465 RepID=A0A4R7CXL2_9SPHI|nr:glycosyltransferase family 4 protein [Sphingobacterium paludis]TDS13279.1 glycosyltransferase involved in cell wall biosynthesis [Sphingobacterium paludis]